MQHSAFDEYDLENGYVEESNTTYLDLFFEIIRYATKKLNSSYLEIMNSDILDYLDYMDYQILNPIQESEVE